MELNQLKELARYAVTGKQPANFSLDNSFDVDRALADGFKELCGSVNNYMRNKFDIFDIIIENADTIVPAKVMAAMGQFAEIKVVAEGNKPLFKRGLLGRNRAKKFLTQVGLSGVYESFRLDHETFTVAVKSIGGAVSIDFEQLINGEETLQDFIDVLAEAQEDAIYGEVQGALMAAANNIAMPTKNKFSGTYSAAKLQEIVNVVKAYGNATIFASPEFVAAMGPDAIVAPTSALPGVYSPKDIEEIAKTGTIHSFRGTPIVELKQSYLDEKNEQVMINPQFAYILPAGKEKVVKIVLEGDTQIYDATNRDQSVEINTYHKVGVGISAFNNWGVFRNTDIPADNWYDSATLGL